MTVDMSEWEWEWFCRNCEEVREVGEDATICEDPDECHRPEDWGGCACGYVVCSECRTPLAERRADE